MKDRQACKEWYIRSKARQIMSIPGDSGLAIKTAFLSGLRIDELGYAYNQQVCAQDSCECEKLHVICKSNGLAIIAINWTRKYKKCYFTILPSRLWDNFRSMISFSESEIKNANTISKQEAGIDFAEIRKIYYSVMLGTMDANEIRILGGKTNYEAAKDCMTFGLDSMMDRYCKAWEKYGLVLPVL
jgi:intergrase/recombinase